MTNYLVVWTLKRGILLPSEPIDEQSKAILDHQERVRASLRADAIQWNEKFAPIPRRRGAA